MLAPFESPLLRRQRGLCRVALAGSLLLGCCVPLWGAAASSGVRVVHAVGQGQGGLQIELDGLPWRAAAQMQPGEVSSLRRLEPGPHRFQIARRGLDALRCQVRLEAGKSVTLVCYAAQVDRGDRIAWVIRVRMLNDLNPGERRVVRFVYVGSSPRQWIECRQWGQPWNALILNRLRPELVEIIQPRGYLPLRSRGRPLPALPVSDEAAHVVILYEDAKGLITSLSYRERPLIAVDSSTKPSARP